MPTAGEKLRVFAPQIGSLAAAIIAGDAAVALHAAGPVLMFPLVAIAVLCGSFGLLSTLWKGIYICDNGWSNHLPDVRPCHRCEKLAADLKFLKADRDQLRDALATLQLPP